MQAAAETEEERAGPHSQLHAGEAGHGRRGWRGRGRRAGRGGPRGLRAGSKVQVGRCPPCRPYAGEEEARERQRALDLARSSLRPWP